MFNEYSTDCNIVRLRMDSLYLLIEAVKPEILCFIFHSFFFLVYITDSWAELNSVNCINWDVFYMVKLLCVIWKGLL